MPLILLTIPPDALNTLVEGLGKRKAQGGVGPMPGQHPLAQRTDRYLDVVVADRLDVPLLDRLTEAEVPVPVSEVVADRLLVPVDILDVPVSVPVVVPERLPVPVDKLDVPVPVSEVVAERLPVPVDILDVAVPVSEVVAERLLVPALVVKLPVLAPTLLVVAPVSTLTDAEIDDPLPEVPTAPPQAASNVPAVTVMTNPVNKRRPVGILDVSR